MSLRFKESRITRKLFTNIFARLSLADAFIAAIVIGSLVSAFNALRTDGVRASCSPAILFFRSERFSDQSAMLQVAHANRPYELGLQYPPGALPVWRLVSVTPDWMLRWSGMDWIQRHSVLPGLHAMGEQACRVPQLVSPDVLPLAIAGGLELAVIATFLLFSGERLAFRVATGICVTLGVLGVTSLLDWYALILAMAATISLVAIIVQVTTGRRVPSVVFSPLIACMYPVIFAIDRGNIDVYVFLLIAIFIVFFLQARRPILAVHVSAIILACAIVIKFFPIFLIGLFFRRRSYRLGLITMAVGVIAVYYLSLVGTSESLLDPLIGIRKNLTTSPSSCGVACDPGWGLIFGRSLLAFIQYSGVMLGGTNRFSEWYSLLAPHWSRISLVAVFVGAAILSRRRLPLWVSLGLATSLVMAFNTGGGVYRLSLVLISAVVMIWQLQKSSASVVYLPPDSDIRAARPAALHYLLVFVMGLSVAPFYVGRIPLSVLGAAPKDTLFGSGFLIVLVIIFGIIACTPRLWFVSR